MRLRLFILAALIAPMLGQNVPAPQLNLTGNIGCIGFPCLNSGTYQMTGDSNFTLSSSNVNTSAVSIKITSSTALTASRTITYPAGNFLLNVENATAGGHSIIIAGPTGAGVTIPNGQEVTVWYDGTNYVAFGGVTVGTTYIPAGSAATTIAGLFSVTIDLASTYTAGLNLTGTSTYGTHATMTDKYLGNTWYFGVEGTNQTNYIGEYVITPDATWQTAPFAVSPAGIIVSHISTLLNCAYVQAIGNPVICGNETNGTSLLLAGSTSVTINTTAVLGAGSHIFIQPDASLGAVYPVGTVTCNSVAGQGTASLYISARTPGTSFTVTTTATTAITTNPVCFSWWIGVN